MSRGTFSGPNHGHYISIIKTMGAWLVFDDDTVDTIKESDIPKYFGESNCGSAYVLYYQAADLDLGTLGLHPPSPEPVANHNQHRMSDSPVSTSQTLPQLPPGLGYEPRSPVVSSVSSQAHIPVIQQDPPPSSPHKSPRKSPSQLLKLSLGSPSSSNGSPSASSVEPLSPRRSGLLRPVRTITQTKATEEKPNSPYNPITSPLAFPREDPVSHDPPLINVNGKEERRIPSWFRRKSLKSSGKPRPNSETAADLPPLPTDVLGTASAHHAVLAPAKNLHSPQESFATSMTSRLNFGRPSTASGKIHSSPYREAPPLLSTNQSVTRTTTSVSHSSDRYSRALPPIPASPHGPKNSQVPPSSFSRSHKVPGRPATSSGPIGADASPSRFMNGSAHFQPMTNGHVVHEMNGDASLSSGSSPRTGKSGRPKSAHGFNLPSLASASNAASTAGTSIQRARRKLSLTAPMLGFGKKDKSKDKGRESDHERPPTFLNGRSPVLDLRPMGM